MANPYESRSGMQNSYSGGSKQRSYLSGPSYSGTRTPKTDIYSRNGGPGHGHKVKTGNGFTTFSRPGPRGTKSLSLGEILFGPAPKKRRR
jgi:hypothetical protein